MFPARNEVVKQRIDAVRAKLEVPHPRCRLCIAGRGGSHIGLHRRLMVEGNRKVGR